MGVIDNAVTRALEIAADDSHGYDQTSRWEPGVYGWTEVNE